jgi:hypothetical protein
MRGLLKNFEDRPRTVDAVALRIRNCFARAVLFKGLDGALRRGESEFQLPRGAGRRNKRLGGMCLPRVLAALVIAVA